MDIHIVIAKAIDDLVAGKCATCEIGKCLITLKQLRDSSGNSAEQAVSGRNKPDRAGLKRKLQKKTAKPAMRTLRKPKPSESESDADLNQEIVDFLQNHPDSRSQEIAEELGVSKGTIHYHMKQLTDLVDRHGDTTRCRYRLKGKSPVIPEAQTTSGIIRCKLCDYRALDKARLDSHMKTSHGMTAV